MGRRSLGIAALPDAERLIDQRSGELVAKARQAEIAARMLGETAPKSGAAEFQRRTGRDAGA